MKFFNYLYLSACVVSIFFSAHTTQASRLEIMEGREAPGLYSIPPRLSLYEGEKHYEDNKGISQLYFTNCAYPKVPLIHPYHPENPAQERINLGVASIPLTAHFPVSIRNGLPQAIRDELARNHVADNCLKIFLSTQNFPWNPGTVTCFRPQYATEPRATEQGYNKARQLRTGLFNSEGNRVFFTGRRPNELIDILLSAHPKSLVNPVDPRTILSGPQPEIQGLAPDRGSSFWSYVGYQDDQDGNKYKAIVTLHWLLSDRQEAALSGGIRRLSANPNEAELENLVITLAKNPDLLNGEHFQKLDPLWKALKQKYKAAEAQKQAQLAAQKKEQAATARQRQAQLAAQKKEQAATARQKQAQLAAQKKAQAATARQRQAQLAAQKKAQIAEARKQTRLAAAQKRLQVRAERARIAAQKRLQAIAAKTRRHQG